MGKILPDFPEIRAADELLRQNRPDQAIPVLELYCNSKQSSAQAWFLLSVAYHQIGKPESALQSLERAISIEPRHLQARSAKGAVLCDLGRHREALQVYRKALHLAPSDAQLLVNMGIVLEQMGDASGALERYSQALKLQPNFASALLNRGTLLIKRGRREEALANNRRLVELMPDWDLAQYNLGEALLALGYWEEALAAYKRTLGISRSFTKAIFAKGLALSMLRRFDEAQRVFDLANSIDPAVVEQCIRIASSLSDGDVREIAPEVIYLLKGSQRLEICDWTDRDAYIADFERLIENAPGRPNKLTERSLLYRTLFLPIPAAARLLLASNVSAHIVDKLKSEPQPSFVHDRHPGSKLRIGYISPDFGFHPVGRLTRRLYGLHDRSRFEVVGYAIDPGNDRAIRRDIEQGCDIFRDLAAMNDAEAATLIHADKIDILVDLAGYTTNARSEIIALRPAPVQVSYNGFPSSMGASFVDYFITDEVCSPPGQHSQFIEKLVYLPNSCMIYNNREQVSTRVMSRAELGLPEKGFVYCCFNNSYKIEPVVFEVWIRILKRVPDSVLWLSGKNQDMIANLRKEAECRGVSGNRLVFAPYLPGIDEHLARHRMADLFLDTLFFNAVTTAADALWAGLPVLSCPGSTYISRWASSMLKAVGLNDMVVENIEQYEERACYLASRLDELAEIKSRLEANRLTQPLFDTERYVKHLESAYQTMWHKHVAGLPPESFHVVE